MGTMQLRLRVTSRWRRFWCRLGVHRYLSAHPLTPSNLNMQGTTRGGGRALRRVLLPYYCVGCDRRKVLEVLW